MQAAAHALRPPARGAVAGRRARAIGLLLAGGLGALWLAAGAGVAGAEEPASGFAAGRLWIDPDRLTEVPPEMRAWRARRNTVNAVKAGLALAGAALLGWGAWLRARGRSRAHSRLRDRSLALLGIAGLFGWWNFFHFHYPSPVHLHDVFHYAVGTKYFPELGYRQLYRCVAIADSEAGLGERVATRWITDLESYGLEPASRALADPQACKAAFSEERWGAFARDVAFFRAHLAGPDWERLQRDHGYNPTPVWSAVGGVLVGDAPIDTPHIVAWVLLDPVLDLLMWAAALWGFGWRATCVALLYWGTNHPAEFGWTGGALLRDAWLAACVGGVACLARGRAIAAGFLLATAAALRVFPALLLLPLAWQALTRRRAPESPTFSATERRLAAGVGLALALWLPASFAAGGAEVWSQFAANLRTHVSHASLNSVGLRPLVSFSPATRQQVLETEHEDAARAWLDARAETWQARRPWFWLLAAAGVAALLRAARGRPAWLAAVMGAGLVPVLLAPSSYDLSLLLLFGLLWDRRPEIGAALAALSAAGWAVAAVWLRWDDIAAGSSLAILLFLAFAAWRLQPARGRDDGGAEQPA